VRTFDCRWGPRGPVDPGERAAGLDMAAAVIRRGGLVVLPTDTVYGIAADAFSPDAVGALLQAKGRTRGTPVSVLVPRAATLDGITHDLSDEARSLVAAFWPGALTVVARQAPSLSWDLGDTEQTVSVRMPLHPVALDLLRRTGPLAVLAANRAGEQPPTPVADAQRQLGDAVEVWLDGGTRDSTTPSTIVDVTAAPPVVVREGDVTVEQLRAVVPTVQAAS